jgi:hypothetical protein
MFDELSGKIEKLRKLADEMHFARQICEHLLRNKSVCSFPYCYKIHLLRESGREIFDSDFPFKDYNTCFLKI